MTETQPGVAEFISPILKLSNAERIEFLLKDRWIGYPKAREIINELEYLLRQPKRTRMEGLLLVAKTNNGKTSLVNHFIRENVGKIDGKFAYVEIPTRATLKQFCHTLLKTLGIPSMRSESTVELHYKILVALDTHKIRMLFVDEIHNLLESRHENLMDVLNGLKGLSNQAKIPIVLIGIETAAATIYVDTQISNRFPAWELPTWEYNPDFRDFVHTLENILPLHKPSNLSGKEKSWLVYKYSIGMIGDVVKILTRAAEQAIISGEECITVESIKNIGERIAKQRSFKP